MCDTTHPCAVWLTHVRHDESYTIGAYPCVPWLIGVQRDSFTHSRIHSLTHALFDSFTLSGCRDAARWVRGVALKLDALRKETRSTQQVWESRSEGVSLHQSCRAVAFLFSQARAFFLWRRSRAKFSIIDSECLKGCWWGTLPILNTLGDNKTSFWGFYLFFFNKLKQNKSCLEATHFWEDTTHVVFVFGCWYWYIILQNCAHSFNSMTFIKLLQISQRHFMPRIFQVLECSDWIFDDRLRDVIA